MKRLPARDASIKCAERLRSFPMTKGVEDGMGDEQAPAKQRVLARFPAAECLRTGDGYWYIRGAFDVGFVQYTEAEAWEAHALRLPKAAAVPEAKPEPLATKIRRCPDGCIFGGDAECINCAN